MQKLGSTFFLRGGVSVVSGEDCLVPTWLSFMNFKKIIMVKYI